MSEPFCRLCGRGGPGYSGISYLCRDCRIARTHDDHYRTAMSCMARFMVWVWMEAEAQVEYGDLHRDLWMERSCALIDAIERGMFRLEWGQ